MVFDRILSGFLRTLIHTLLAFLGISVLAIGYSVGVIWLQTGSAPDPILWPLILSLTALAALLGAALVLVWRLAPVLSVYRVLRSLAEREEAPIQTAIPARVAPLRVMPAVARPAHEGPEAAKAQQGVGAARGRVHAA